MSGGLIGYRDQVAPAPTKGGPIRDIRKFIAQSQTKQMDANEFPPYEYRRYPLMPIGVDGKPFLDAVGRHIVLVGPDDEEAFYQDHPEVPRVRDPMDVQDELATLRAENAKLRAAKDGAKDGAKDPDPEPEPTIGAAPDKPNGVAGLTRNTHKDPPRPKPGSKLD